MSPARKNRIMESLKAGNFIQRYWNGANSSGYLMHKLEGVRVLRESEVEELRKAGVPEIVPRIESNATFRPLRLAGRFAEAEPHAE